MKLRLKLGLLGALIPFSQAQQYLKIGVVVNMQTSVQQAGTALLNYTATTLNALNAFPIPIQLIVLDSNSSIRKSVLQADALVNTQNISALIGITQPLVSSMSQYNLIQCSCSGSAALSSKTEYPTYFRSTPSDALAAQSFISLMAIMKWAKVGLLVNDAPYGIGLLNAFVASASMNGIQILSTQLYSTGQTNFTATFNNLKAVDTRIMFIFGTEGEIPAMLAQANTIGMIGPQYVYVGAAATIAAYDNLYGSTVIVTAAVTQSRSLMDGFMVNAPYEDINMTLYSNVSTKFFQATGIVAQPSNFYQNDCLLAMIAGFNRLMTQGVTLSQILTRTIPNYSSVNFLNTSTQSSTGVLNFDSNGDRTGDFSFISISNGVKIPAVVVNQLGVASLIAAGPIFASGSSIVPNDSVIYTKVSFDLSQSGVIALAVILGVGALFSLASCILIIRFRNWETVKAVSPNITILIAIGLNAAFLAPFAYMTSDVTKLRCQAHLYTQHMAIVMSLSFVIVKAYRIYKVFDNASSLKKEVRSWVLITKGAFVVALMGVVVTVGDTLFPEVPVLVLVPSNATYYTECRSSSYAPIIVILLFEATLLIVANLLAYKTRHAHAAYGESKFIRMAVQNVLLMNIIVRFVQFAFGDIAFLTKLYIEGFIFAYSDLFLSSCLVLRPILRAIIGFNKDGTKKVENDIAAGEAGNFEDEFRKPMLAELGPIEIVVYVRDESHLFSNWKKNVIAQDEEGLTLTPLLRASEEATDATERKKGTGVFFAKGTFNVWKHSSLADTLSVQAKGRCFTVQFEVEKEGGVWLKDLVTKQSMTSRFSGKIKSLISTSQHE